MSTAPKTSKRILLYIVGWLNLIMAIAGFLLPVLPGTVFFIISLACFTKCSPKFRAYVMKSPRLAHLLDKYENGEAFSKKLITFTFICSNGSSLAGLYFFPAYRLELSMLMIFMNLGLYTVFFTKF
ncbi:DUF454 family protein [Lentisphaera profundi]|uniref:DUF454 family protein n=1 Tax=Lentisphaera profundi TaxID=1658616 RepID=A0ABY7VWL4_9BACT|nr:DUF454 family protein [Lentisphaera profundi]WDE98296.1 DUF454 family protein [Lentisphaera profundi]